MRAPQGWPSAGEREGDTTRGCRLMGVLNVTPDSFSDGGLWLDPEAAVEHGLAMVAEGADIVDVGGESTRPGATRVPVDEELRRVVPVVARLTAAGVPVSIDTMRAEVARAALDAGAAVINDVSGGNADPEMAELAATTGVPFIVMHWRGQSDVMDGLAGYHDVLDDVVAELRRSVDRLVDAGVKPESLLVDPGLGFAKRAEHNWKLLAALDQVLALGFPVLIGASRKRFLGSLLAETGRPGPDGGPAPVEFRDAASAAVTAIAAAAGVFCVRVHAVGANRDAVAVGNAVHDAVAVGNAVHDAVHRAET